jgi:hypothetical protein
MIPAKFLDRVIGHALAEARSRQLSIFTFAFYFDYESRAVSVCIDTEENSLRTVKEINVYNYRHFLRAANAGDLSGAAMWNANIGRSLSLGDFSVVNLARVDVPEADVGQEFFQSMLLAVIRNQPAIESQARDKDRLILCCSGPDDEVEFVWSAMETEGPAASA